MKKYFDIRIGLICFATVGLLIVLKPFSSKGTSQEISRMSSVVVVEDQPDSPLKIVITSANLAAFPTPEVQYLLINKSHEPIRAYTIKHTITTAHTQFSGHDCQVIRSVQSFLQPGQTARGTLNNNGSTELVTSIKLSVDVVEFDEEGQFWGPNSTKTRDLISGMHFGTKTAIKYYQQKRKLTDPAKLGESLKAGAEQNTMIDSQLIKEKTDEWLKGYQNAFAAVRKRLTRAYESYGVEELDGELNRAVNEIERR